MAQVVLPTFQWGSNGQPKTASDLARQQKVIDALLAKTDKLPTDLWSGLNSVVAQGVGNVLQGREDTAMNEGRDKYSAAFSALGDHPDRAALMDLENNDFGNDGQSAVVKALLAQNIDQSDPAHALDMKYKQAQIDALSQKAEPQPLKMSNGDVLLDSTTKQQIWPPPTAPGGAPAPAVGFTPDGAVDPVAQDAFLKTLDPKDAILVKGIVNYELDPTKVLSMRGGGESERQRLITLAKQADPSYDGTQFGVRQAVRKDFTSGQSAMNLKSANTLIGHLHELLGASAGLDNTNMPLVNMLLNAGKSNFGSADPIRYGLAAQASADELAKVFKGGGTSDVESIKGWQSKLDVNGSPAQQKAAVTEAITLLQSRISALRDQYQSATGKPANFTFLDQKAAKAIKDLGFEPTDIDPNYKPGAPVGPPSGSGSPDERGSHPDGLPVPGFSDTFIKALP